MTEPPQRHLSDGAIASLREDLAEAKDGEPMVLAWGYVAKALDEIAWLRAREAELESQLVASRARVDVLENRDILSSARVEELELHWASKAEFDALRLRHADLRRDNESLKNYIADQRGEGEP